MIKRIELNNFKQHGSRVFEFTEGLNLITGPNYSGKTTILYAILYALGGATHVPGTNIQKMGTNTGLSVVMEFSAGEDDYKVVRRKSGAYLYRGEEVLASGTTAVNERVEEILGMGMKRFRQLKYAEQKKAHALLTTGAAELHQILDDLHGVGQVNDALERLKDIISAAAGALEVLKHEEPAPLEADVARVEEEISGRKILLAVEEATQSGLQTEVDALAETVTGLEAGEREFNRVEALRNRLYAAADPLEERARGLQEKITMTDEQLADLGDNIKTMTDELARLIVVKGEITAAVKRRDELQVKLEKTEKALASAKASVSAVQAEMGNFPLRLQELTSEAEKLEAREHSANFERETALGEMVRLRAAADAAECPTCGRAYEGCAPVSEEEIDVHRVRAAAMQEEIDRVKAARKEVQARLVRLRSDKADLDRSYDREIELAGTVRELATELDGLRDITSGTAPNVAAYSDQLNKLKDTFTDQWRYRNEFEEAMQKLARARQAIKDAPPLPVYHREALTQARAALREAEEALNAAVGRAGFVKHEIATLGLSLKYLRERLAAVIRGNAEYRAKASRHANAKALQKYLKDNRDRYASEIWEFFLATASEFVSNCTSGSLSGIRRNDAGQFTYLKDGYEMGLKDASGAQEAIMGLGVQFALADSAMCPLDTLLVDEPTADMDPEHSMATTAMLASRGRQVIAISHREMDSSLCSNMITLAG